jgi:hypothetical protein
VHALHQRIRCVCVACMLSCLTAGLCVYSLYAGVGRCPQLVTSRSPRSKASLWSKTCGLYTGCTRACDNIVLQGNQMQLPIGCACTCVARPRAQCGAGPRGPKSSLSVLHSQLHHCMHVPGNGMVSLYLHHLPLAQHALKPMHELLQLHDAWLHPQQPHTPRVWRHVHHMCSRQGHHRACKVPVPLFSMTGTSPQTWWANAQG